MDENGHCIEMRDMATKKTTRVPYKMKTDREVSFK